MAEESNVRMFNVESGAKPSGIGGTVGGEDEGAHGGFTAPRLTHEEDFAFHGGLGFSRL